MRKIETLAYTFEELSATAKERAIEKLYDINVMHDWWDMTYEDAGRIGLKISGFDIDRNKHATGDFTGDAIECAHLIKDEHGDACETYKTAISFLEDRDHIVNNAAKDENGDLEDENELDEELDECEKGFLNSILEDYANILQGESEYLQSEESIIDTIKANDYEFTEDGDLI